MAGGIWLISLVSLFLGFSKPQPYAQGYAGIAHFLLQHTPKERNEIVFWDGDDYQLMALALREQDNNRRILLWRSSKYLFAHAILSEYELWNVRTNQEDILELFNKYVIRYIILSYETEFEVKGIQSLRELVQDKNKFSLATKFQVKNTWSKEGGGEIRVFYYKEATPLTGETELEIPMPNLGRTIKLNLQLK